MTVLASDTSSRLITVVVPARNEVGLLPSCLSGILAQDFSGLLHVIVVANGCDDGTAQISRSWQCDFEAAGHRLEVVQIREASKPAALNAADALAAPSIRIYLDADVELSRNAISEVAKLLSPGTGVHLAAPRLIVAPGRSWVTRCYGEVWTHLPYIRQAMVGYGFYAVSHDGRSRWREFPDIASDDKFVRLHFAATERSVASKAFFQIRVPEGIAELVAVRGRWCRGNHQLRRMFPSLARNDQGRHQRLLTSMVRSPTLWWRTPVFGLVYALAELRAFWTRRVGLQRWERAESARGRGQPVTHQLSARILR